MSGAEARQAAIDGLQAALATEHAALWCYSLAAAFLTGPAADQADQDARDHLRLRSAVERTLSRLGARAVSAQPAYATPEPVVDADSAAGLLRVAETDALAAWRSLLERSADPAVRRPALNALVEGTLRCARWRVVTGTPPAIPVFPGRDDPT
ncbi:ferritin-like domain-containing protein [Pseudonocardia humida]|uniref:Ferritin-like domain-containing protein n=1 Tax=Pseudonocardia humida TaxID=2800819 RepID=A0ABT0ZUM9_9PSEU|nr:ferritin-like domain-containing protein [Pseudonocardia humida]MCO1654442.1 ferritin-like domain-containing protein [Pseudonocardia humida]